MVQQRGGMDVTKVVAQEIEARLMTIARRHQWSMTVDDREEAREMIAEVRQMRKDGEILMPTDEVPKAILEQMAEIVEVLEARREGRTAGVRCRVCGTPVPLVEVAATNTLLVRCEKGGSRMRAQRAKP